MMFVSATYNRSELSRPRKRSIDSEFHTVTTPFLDVLEGFLNGFNTPCSAEERKKGSGNRTTGANQPAMELTTHNASRAQIASLCTAMRTRQWNDDTDLKYRAIRVQAIFHIAFMRTPPKSDRLIAHLRAALTRPKDKETNTLFFQKRNKVEKVRKIPAEVPEDVFIQATSSDVPIELVRTRRSRTQGFNHFWLGLSTVIGCPAYSEISPNKLPLSGSVEINRGLRSIFPDDTMHFATSDSDFWKFEAEADVRVEYLAVEEGAKPAAHVPVVKLHAYAREVWRTLSRSH